MGLSSYIRDIFGPQAGDVTWPGQTRVEWERANPEAAASIASGTVLPKPRLAAVTKAPSPEAFEAWRDNPITQFVFAAYRQQVRVCEQAWVSHSWVGGSGDPVVLAELRARADTYKSMEESDYLAICEAAGVEPENGEGG